MHRLRLIGWLALVGLVLSGPLLAGCGLIASDSPDPTPTTAATAGQPNGAGRPLVPVPSVKPEGLVDPPPGTGLGRYTAQQLDWTRCGDKQCATALAPLDYGDPDGQAVTLALARKKAKGEPRLGSLFINPGGPGGSGVSYVDSFSAKGLEAFDIVGWDPRGVGDSTPVVCSNGADLDRYNAIDYSPDDQAEEQAWIDGNRDFGRSCLDRSGVLLEHISTEETVRDLDLLRQLVGDPLLNYYGASYGTDIGSLYAELFPAQTGHLVLDGAVNISGEDTEVSQAVGFERALVAFSKWCGDRECKLGKSSKEVLASITGFFDQLDAKPLQVSDRELTQSLAVTGVLFVLYDNEKGFPYLYEALLNAIQDSDGAYLLWLADGYNERAEDGTYGKLITSFSAVRCLDEADEGIAGAEAHAAKINKQAPILGPYFGPDLVCPMWPVAAVPKRAKITGAGATPLIVIGTTGDSATPYEYAVNMAKQLESGVLVTFNGQGHLAYRQSECVRQLVVRYLTLDEVPKDPTTC